MTGTLVSALRALPAAAAAVDASLPTWAVVVGAAAGWAAARRLLTCELLRVSKTASIVTFLYFLLAIASIAAIVVITVQFADDVANPESGIELVRHDALAMPTVTVCSTQTGVPLRRLQFFNYTDAAGVRVSGPLPNAVNGSDAFEAVVERFWDNPDGEDCDRICGNFFPLPVRSLQRISAGEVATKCRPCFRTGSVGPEVIARSTAFSAAAFMELYTDHAFFQCMFREDGVDDQARDEMRESVANTDNAVEFFGTTPLAPGDPTPVLTVPATSTRAEAIAASARPSCATSSLCGAFPPLERDGAARRGHQVHL
eukprot:TRINITY_DN1609_c1_g1_i3.p1 TRINITY_DN1609_c1_g1~~TRINITY_DN1609_c1_g1_i3.p1  ORF type:complete len:314 (-),score=93.18 TRINITY_DN1609_c1_g1_i3:935-1876(-)